MRLLWARVGLPHCPDCGKEVARRTVQEIVDDVLWRFEGHAVAVWSPAVRNRKGAQADLFRALVEQGYLEGRVNGRDADFENPSKLEKNLRHDIDVRIDRIRLERVSRQRLTEAVEAGLRLGAGAVGIESLKAPKLRKSDDPGEQRFQTEQGESIAYSEEFACPEHGALDFLSLGALRLSIPTAPAPSLSPASTASVSRCRLTLSSRIRSILTSMS
jgi:excinuclease ABC subunit A